MYQTDQQISRKLGLSAQQWKDLRQQFELRGMPKPDPLTGMRWWPAVEEWFNRRHSLPAITGSRAPKAPNLPTVELTENLNALSRTRRKAADSSAGLGRISAQ